MTARRAANIAALAACLCAASARPAGAATSASIEPSLLPEKLGVSTTFTLGMRFSGGLDRVPAPLSKVVVHLPPGLSISLHGVGVCARSRLQSRGRAGCPASSLLGRGRALLKVHAGSQTLPEEATVAVFRGPNRGGHPTFEIFGHGETPLDESTISTAVLQGDSAPFGSKLVVSVPPIPTLVYEPDASFSSLSIRLGNVGSPLREHRAGAIFVPRRCPRGGFPFEAAFSFADHSFATAAATVPCPKRPAALAGSPANR